MLPTPNFGKANIPAPFGGDMGQGMGGNNNYGLSTGVTGIASGLAALFGAGGKNPADAGMGYLNQVPGATSQYTNPYLNAGKQATGVLQGEYGKDINDPNAQYNKFAQGYEESPGYKFSVDQATKGANQAAAAGGMLGSPAEQQELSKVIQGLSSQDFEQFLSHIMGIYGQGISGQQGMFNTGAQTANNMAQSAQSNLNNQAQLAYQGQASQNQAQGGGFNQLINGIGSALPSLLSYIGL
jgi:hypothetical protein